MRTFNHFLSVLQADLTESPNMDISGETLHNFEDYPEIEIGPHLNDEGELNGIYFAMVLSDETLSDEFTKAIELMDKTLVDTLTDYLKKLYEYHTPFTKYTINVHSEIEVNEFADLLLTINK